MFLLYILRCFSLDWLHTRFCLELVNCLLIEGEFGVGFHLKHLGRMTEILNDVQLSVSFTDGLGAATKCGKEEKEVLLVYSLIQRLLSVFLSELMKTKFVL
jgi:hypothetical protein